MKIHTLKREAMIDRPLDEVFPFFAQPENLARITPPSLGFEILTPTPIAMREGAVIEYRVRPMGIPRFWRSMITVYEPPHRFVDIQLNGPYAFWNHEHRFVGQDGKTLVTDEVRYALPFWPLGELAHPLLVRPQLAKIFEYRSRVIKELFDK